MYKSIKLLLGLQAIVCLAHSQSFKGVIRYTNRYQSHIGQVSDEEWGRMMGTEQIYYQEEGYYKSELNGNMLQWQIYRPDENKVYTQFAGTGAVLWNDAAANTDSILKWEITPDKAVILGYSCHELVLTCRSGMQRYYFAPSLATDPALFAGHAMANWAAVMSLCKAVPLKLVIENNQFTLTSVAVNVERKDPDDALFRLPDNASVQKSPY